MSLQNRLAKLEGHTTPTAGPEIIIVRAIVAPGGNSYPAYAYFVGHAVQLSAEDGETCEGFSGRCEKHLSNLKAKPNRKEYQ
ncbi:hypothetical protein [Pseudooceanicola sp. MF1-13]|uniref:hypothetical protein n=1 Tax=Pseudooceanicola sp. MF1-13 TaxID=3379095 RepID=UPI0038915BFE